MGAVEIRRLKQLEEENLKLQRPAADFSLDKAMLQEVLQKGVALTHSWYSTSYRDADNLLRWECAE